MHIHALTTTHSTSASIFFKINFLSLVLFVANRFTATPPAFAFGASAKRVGSPVHDVRSYCRRHSLRPWRNASRMNTYVNSSRLPSGCVHLATTTHCLKVNTASSAEEEGWDGREEGPCVQSTTRFPDPFLPQGRPAENPNIALLCNQQLRNEAKHPSP